jgi:5-methylcytosine-specific restriction protein B
LLALRRHHELEYGVDIDYYTPPLRDLVDLSTEKAKKGVIKAGAASEVAGADDPFEDNPSTPESPVEPARNVVYYGPPGTGKTRKLENLRQHAYARGDYFMFVTFHPSYSYEDFIVGLRPVIVEGVVAVEVKHGPFIELCIKAHADPSRRFVLFIDEINRANVSKVFGEVISLVEPGRRVPPGSTGNQDHLSVTLPLLDKPLSVPNNIDIYASMNSADRSLVHLDTALRRRFEFVEIAPDAAAVEPGMVDGVDLRALLTRLNERLEWLLDRDHLIGHALLMSIYSMDRLRAVFRTSIIPLLEEYFYEDRGRVGLALMGKSNAKPFIERRSLNPGVLFADTDIASESAKDVFIVGDPASWAVEDFQRIYAAPAVSGSTG